MDRGTKAWPTAEAKALMNRLIDITRDFMFSGALEKAYSYEVTLVKISEIPIRMYGKH